MARSAELMDGHRPSCCCCLGTASPGSGLQQVFLPMLRAVCLCSASLLLVLTAETVPPAEKTVFCRGVRDVLKWDNSLLPITVTFFFYFLIKRNYFKYLLSSCRAFISVPSRVLLCVSWHCSAWVSQLASSSLCTCLCRLHKLFRSQTWSSYCV